MELDANKLETVTGGSAPAGKYGNINTGNREGMRNTDAARVFLENVVDAKIHESNASYGDLCDYMQSYPDAYISRCSYYGMTMDEWLQMLQEVYDARVV